MNPELKTVPVQAPSAMEVAQQGYDSWAAKPHNAKWVRKIDGTPIPNDLVVCIAAAFMDAWLRSEIEIDESAASPPQPVAGHEGARLDATKVTLMTLEKAMRARADTLYSRIEAEGFSAETPNAVYAAWTFYGDLAKELQGAIDALPAPPPPPADLKVEAKALRSKLCLTDICRSDAGCGCLDALADALSAAHAAGKAEGEAGIERWNADARRLSGCLIAIHQAPDTATLAALKSVAYDAALNCISRDVAKLQIERRSEEETGRRNEQAEREADAREG